MSKLSTSRLLELAAARREVASKRSPEEVQWSEATQVFTRAKLSSEKKWEVIEAIRDTQWKIEVLLEKTRKWPLETQWKQTREWSYRSSYEQRHSTSRAGTIRKIKNQVVAWYTTVTEILDNSSSISHNENLKLLWEINYFDETHSTTLVSSEVQIFQKTIFDILKPILTELWVIK